MNNYQATGDGATQAATEAATEATTEAVTTAADPAVRKKRSYDDSVQQPR